MLRARNCCSTIEMSTPTYVAVVMLHQSFPPVGLRVGIGQRSAALAKAASGVTTYRPKKATKRYSTLRKEPCRQWKCRW